MLGPLGFGGTCGACISVSQLVLRVGFLAPLLCSLFASLSNGHWSCPQSSPERLLKEQDIYIYIERENHVPLCSLLFIVSDLIRFSLYFGTDCGESECPCNHSSVPPNAWASYAARCEKKPRMHEQKKAECTLG